jgi:hypothetical protein
VFVRIEGADGRIRVWWLDAEGDTVGRAEAGFVGRSFTDGDREAALAPFIESHRSIPGYDAGAWHAAALEQIPWPAEHPPFTEALIGDDDRLWLRRDPARDSVRWEVWAPELGPTGEAWLPAGLAVKIRGRRSPVGSDQGRHGDVPAGAVFLEPGRAEPVVTFVVNNAMRYHRP